MPERIIRIKKESTWTHPIEDAKKIYDIIKLSDDSYCLKVTHWTNENKRLNKKIDISSAFVAGILEKLSDVKLPAFPEHMIGCDGGYTELEVGGYSGKSHFRWWSVPPVGWEVLDEISKEIIEIGNI